MQALRVALAQINPVVGDLRGNVDKVLAGIQRAEALRVDLLAFPELTLTGYPPEDLLTRPQFISDNLACLEEVRQAVRGTMVVVVGFVDRQAELHNAAAVLQAQRRVGVYYKRCLPNYGVFDEKRYFQSGGDNGVFQLGEWLFGVTICEDLWIPTGPFVEQAGAGEALLLLNLSASPYHAGKPAERWQMFASRARETAAALAVVNLVGGQDELIFDGASAVFSPAGKPIAQGRLFEEDFIVADLDREKILQHRSESRQRREEKAPGPAALRRSVLPLTPAAGSKPDTPTHPPVTLADREEEIYQALTLGTRDYVNKNGFEKVVIGLSGGVDSALTASLAVDALGAERVITLALPSQFSSDETRRDTRQLAENLGVRLLEIPIDEIYATYLKALAPILGPHEMGVTEENIQSRIRGNLLMALSNYYGWLVLNNGNKSE
ncbi:MAG TPA: NAD(+) synthase, partial [Firmicutes bacterium]|nr:NAD(+) synthase [Bacillota bacterium]